jgi:hypothetical protein
VRAGAAWVQLSGRGGGYGCSVDLVEALHVAARRYCMDRGAYWHDRYGEVLAEEQRAADLAGGGEPRRYSPAALATFPRYNALEAILPAVEAFTPADLGSLDEARELLAAAGDTAESAFTRKQTDPMERGSIAEERRRFRQLVRDLTERELAEIEPLPYRRTLPAQESAELWHKLETRWGIAKRSWYPTDRPYQARPPADTIAFNDDAFSSSDLERRLRWVMSGIGVTRVWELREVDDESVPHRELDLELVEPLYGYTGLEAFWFDRSLTWLIFASHEGSLTITGSQLLPALQTAWPDWREHLFTLST